MTREDAETGEPLVSPHIEICEPGAETGIDVNVSTFYSKYAHANFQTTDCIRDAGKSYSVRHVISESPTSVGIRAGHIAKVHRGFIYKKHLKRNLPKAFNLLEEIAKNN